MLNFNNELINSLFFNITDDEINSRDTLIAVADRIEKLSKNIVRYYEYVIPEYRIENVKKLAEFGSNGRGKSTDEFYVFAFIYSGYELLSPDYIDDLYSYEYRYLSRIVRSAKKAFKYSGYEIVIASVIGAETDKWEFGKNEKWSEKVLRLSEKSFPSIPEKAFIGYSAPIR